MTKESKKSEKQPTIAEVRQWTYDFHGMHIRFNTDVGMWQLLADGDGMQSLVSESERAVYSPSLIRIGHTALHLLAATTFEAIVGPIAYENLATSIPANLKLDGFIADGLDRDTLQAEIEAEYDTL